MGIGNIAGVAGEVFWMCSQVPVNYGQATGAGLTIQGFTSVYGEWGSIFTAVAMCCFAFSTILDWGLYGARCIEFLLSETVKRLVKDYFSEKK